MATAFEFHERSMRWKQDNVDTDGVLICCSGGCSTEAK
jgi:hypothetical protein